MYVNVCVRMYACIQVCIYVRKLICMYEYLDVCINVYTNQFHVLGL